MALSHLTLVDLERSNLSTLRFGRLTSRKGCVLCDMFLLTINGKPYIASPISQSHLTLSDIERSVKIIQIFNGRRSVQYTYICQHFIASLIWMSQKSLFAGGVFCSPRALCCCALIYIHVTLRPLCYNDKWAAILETQNDNDLIFNGTSRFNRGQRRFTYIYHVCCHIIQIVQFEMSES